MFNQNVSRIWHYMLPEDAQWMRFPEESLATCHNCPKVKLEGYQPEIKCCTYYPMIPNFQIGLGLKDPQSRKFMENVISRRLVTPEGSVSSPSLWLHSVNEGLENGFGLTSEIVCPFLDREQKLCGVYPYRNSVCNTFFCKHTSEKNGPDLWEKLQELIGQIEVALSQWVLNSIGFDVQGYMNILDSHSTHIDDISTDKRWNEEIYHQFFDTWKDREEELFIACADQITKHKEELFEIACKQKIIQPLKYENAKVTLLNLDQKKYLHPDEFLTGSPIAIEDLWYVFKTTARNFWVDGN